MSDTGDDNPGDDDLLEQIVEHGEAVFTHDWDSGGMGSGAGSESVLSWKGRFAVSSLDTGSSGPYRSLDEALQKNSLLMVTDASRSIWCSMITSDELARRLECCLDEFEIELNGETWVYRADAGVFQRDSEELE